jgi:hypothetical protein
MMHMQCLSLRKALMVNAIEQLSCNFRTAQYTEELNVGFVKSFKRSIWLSPYRLLNITDDSINQYLIYPMSIPTLASTSP